MNARRSIARTAALATAAVLLAGPFAAGAEAAAKKKTPTPTITVKPPAVTRATNATFEFTDTAAGAAFTCALDGAAYTACTSPHTLAGPLAAGTHTFRVRATAPGLTVSNPAAATWTIDLTPPPAPTLSGIPAGPTSATTLSVTLSSTEAGVTYACSVDGGAYAGCTSPVELTGLTHGAHTIAVTATDAVGNVGEPATGAWTVDTQAPPAPTVTTGPAARTNQTTATFAVHGTDPAATLACSLDGGAFAACGPTATYTSLAEGGHTFDVTATDEAGNAASAPRFEWTVDLTAPTPPGILTGPAAQTKDATADFTFDQPADAVALRCAVDSTTEYADCPASFTTATLSDGPHSLLVLAVDQATNESSPTPYSWTVDATPPPAPSVSGPPALTSATSATFGITDAESPVSFTCALDGGEATACADGATYAALSNGPHTLVVTAADAAGNTSTATHTWTVDAAAPAVTVTPPATLVAPVTAAFGEDVTGVTASSLGLRVEGAGTNLAAALTCATAGGAAVSCATGPVRTATLKAAATLVPGQRYVVLANPAGAATIADLAGNALPAGSTPFRALTTVQETAPGSALAWRSVSNSAAFGGAYRTEHLPGAWVAYGFTGTSVTWYTVTGPGQGKADVYVDGVKKATVNNYASRTSYRVARTVSGLTAAKHQLRIVVTGVKGSTAGTGTYVSVDATRVGGTVTNNPTLANKWRTAAATGPSGGYLAQADLAGASASTTFRGTLVSFWTSTGKNRGIAKLYVDGVLKGTYDLYSATTAYNVRRTVTGLSDAVHTVKVVVTGTKRAAATGRLVCLDRWTIG